MPNLVSPRMEVKPGAGGFIYELLLSEDAGESGITCVDIGPFQFSSPEHQRESAEALSPSSPPNWEPVIWLADNEGKYWMRLQGGVIPPGGELVFRWASPCPPRVDAASLWLWRGGRRDTDHYQVTVPNFAQIPAAPAVTAAPPMSAPFADHGPEMRYDLAGNPLPAVSVAPAPQAPDQGGYGYAPPQRPITSGPYANTGPRPITSGPYATERPSAQKKQEAYIPAGMEEAVTGGANWIIAVAVVTVVILWVNILTMGISVPYIGRSGLNIIVSLGLILSHIMHPVPAAAVCSLMTIPFIFLGVLGYKRQAWVFVIAMIIYGIDIPVTIIAALLGLDIWGMVIGTGAHSFIFSRFFAAYTAIGEIKEAQKDSDRYRYF